MVTSVFGDFLLDIFLFELFFCSFWLSGLKMFEDILTLALIAPSLLSLQKTHFCLALLFG